MHNSHLVQALLLDLLGEAPLSLPVAPAAAAQVTEVALSPAATAAIAGEPARVKGGRTCFDREGRRISSYDTSFLH